jgi:3-oxosteroid 1-dehydrogenase
MDSLETDVVVVGSGCAGMVAALTAKVSHLNVVIIEKAAVFGGTTAISGGGAWIPNAPVMRRAGVNDDVAQVKDYLGRIAADCVPEARRTRFIDAAPEMMEFLEKSSPWLIEGFFWGKGFPDYKPGLGGSALGRGIWPTPIDRRRLGDDEKHLRSGWSRVKGLPKGMWLTSVDLHEIAGIRWKAAGITPYIALARLLWRTLRSRIIGERMAANGGALVTRLRLALREAEVPLMLNAPLLNLITDPTGGVIGVGIERGGVKQTIRARRGVVLATGGFEHSEEMRRQYQPFVGKGWSLASPDNNGDGHRAAIAVGANLSLMDEAWWYPAIALPDGLNGLALERKSPGQFIVNGAGERFANEAADYNTFGKIMIEKNTPTVSHIPSWMIIDEWTWRHNIICGHFPGGVMPAEWLNKGCVRKAKSIEDLAVQIGVPAGTLRLTTERFNAFARAGTDGDFNRGESAYDNYNGDPSRKNPNLAEVKRPPFYAFKIFPSDLGTRGGVTTDADARVLRKDGTVIDGLYAAGNVSAPVMGRGYAGPGSTIGPAMTFAWLAARHIASADTSGVASREQIQCV